MSDQMTSVRDWMEFSLYDQERGYYSTHLESLGDYVTAPNFGSYLGQAIARDLARSWKMLPQHIRPKIFTLVEAGCGAQARLAASIMKTLQSEEAELFERLEVILVDRSVLRLDAAIKNLSSVFPGKVFASPDISQIPRIWGVIVSNELLDAFPVRLIKRTASDEVYEGYVAAAADGHRNLEWKKSKDPIAVSFGLDLPRDINYALNLDALKYLETSRDRLEHGLIITIDFGDLRPAVFDRLPLKAFAGGALKSVSLGESGKEDVTSPVDFSLLIEFGERLGLEMLHWETLAGFLIRNGIGEKLMEPSDPVSIKHNLQIKTLVHPYGFGEDFKVLIQGK